MNGLLKFYGSITLAFKIIIANIVIFMDFESYMLLSVFKIKQLCLQSQLHLLTMKASQELNQPSRIKTVHVSAPYEDNALGTR